MASISLREYVAQGFEPLADTLVDMDKLKSALAETVDTFFSQHKGGDIPEKFKEHVKFYGAYAEKLMPMEKDHFCPVPMPCKLPIQLQDSPMTSMHYEYPIFQVEGKTREELTNQISKYIERFFESGVRELKIANHPVFHTKGEIVLVCHPDKILASMSFESSCICVE